MADLPISIFPDLSVKNNNSDYAFVYNNCNKILITIVHKKKEGPEEVGQKGSGPRVGMPIRGNGQPASGTLSAVNGQVCAEGFLHHAIIAKNQNPVVPPGTGADLNCNGLVDFFDVHLTIDEALK